jgi:hypothetical protein
VSGRAKGKYWTGWRFQPTGVPGVPGEPREVLDLVSSVHDGRMWLLTCGHLVKVQEHETDRPKRLRCNACTRLFMVRDMRRRAEPKP